MSKKNSEENSSGLHPQDSNSSRAVYTRSQQAVADVWSQVLDRSYIALTDNFFDLGGDSLKAMEVIARLHAALGVEVPLLAFFEDATIAHAAEVVEPEHVKQQMHDAEMDKHRRDQPP